MKKIFVILAILVVVALAWPNTGLQTALANQPEKVTICHAAGQAGTLQYVTLTISYNAAFGQGGHFNENGTPQAGHEDDYLGACVETPPPPPTDVCNDQAATNTGNPLPCEYESGVCEDPNATNTGLEEECQYPEQPELTAAVIPWTPREPKACANCGPGQTEMAEKGQLVYMFGNTKDCFYDCNRFVVATALQEFSLLIGETPLEDFAEVTMTKTDEGVIYVFPAEYFGRLQVETGTEFAEIVHYSTCSISVGSWAVKDGAIVTTPGMTATDVSVWLWEQGSFDKFLDAYAHVVTVWQPGRVGTFEVPIP